MSSPATSTATVVTAPAPAGRRHRSLVAGGLLTLLVLACAGLSALWTPWPPFEVDLDHKLLQPSLEHWLGTDALGRDVLTLLLLGAQSAIAVGLVAVGLGLSAGTALGLLAAAHKGWLDQLIMRAADFGQAFPAILTAIMITTVDGPGMANAMLAIGIYNIPVFARVARASAQGIWTRDYVLAARANGYGPWRITWSHVLPNIAPVLVVQGTVQFALAILAEAALAYLGLGTQPPEASWGRMLNDAQTLLFQAPLLAIYPGVAIAVAVLGLNLLGDGLRDLLDPRQSTTR